MPGADPKHPRPACVEDWDEDAQTTISFTRTTASANANVAVKRSSSGLYADPAQLKYNRDGSDSGYSSKAGTVASASTNGKKPHNLSIDTSLPERERQPYAMTPQSRPNIRRGSSDRPSAAQYVPTPVRDTRFVHPPGVCWTCDQIGYHVDAKEYARLQPPSPVSPRMNKKPSKPDQEPEPKLRRMSSTRESRPPTIYPPSATQPFYAANPVYPSSGYSTPITPHSQMPYHHDPMVYSYAAVTPMTSQYVGYPGQSDYFTPHHSERERPAKPSRRSSIYGEPVIQQVRKEETRTIEKASSKEARPTVKSHNSTRSIDQQRADSEAMPPPERPSQRAENPRRPSIKKAATYNTAIVDHRRSRGPDDYEYKDIRVPPRQPSPIREIRPPPSAYKHTIQAEPAPSRPHVQRKSVSYSDPVTMTHVSSSKVQESESSTHHPRRNTAPTKHPTIHEQKEADAEAYIQRKSKLTSKQLTAEKMAEMKSSKRTVSSRSETGSQYSHNSHQSSSKTSSRRQRSHTSGQRTSILLDGGIKLDIPKDYMDRTGRPLSMQFGDLSISVGNQDRNSTSSSAKREQKMIEKAPSVASHASKRSATDSSHTSSKGKEKHRDDPERLSRRSSHVSESRPPISGHGHSQRSSRPPSSTRASVDYGRSGRHSADYDQSRFVYGA